MAAPKVGDQVLVRGQLMTVYKVRPMGTIDVEAKNGKCYRVTGLNFAMPTMTALVNPCWCGHEKGDHQMRIGQRGNYTPCNTTGCGCDGFRKEVRR